VILLLLPLLKRRCCLRESLKGYEMEGLDFFCYATDTCVCFVFGFQHPLSCLLDLNI
jgi:hypothetical protein